MNEKKYIIYLDILGFEALPEELAKKTGFNVDDIRQKYLSDPLEKKIKEMERKGILRPEDKMEGSDNCVLMVDDIHTAFELVEKFTTIKIPHKDHKFIPLEVALGTETIDEDIEVTPINRKEIINFLKEDIINPYRSYYKKENDSKTIKETFVLFTPAFFDELDLLNKKYCEQISYNSKAFFVADLEKIRQKARIFDFLKKIGYEGSNKLYGRVSEVYVPPSEYEDIARTLKEKRIVFITGTQEYGKTYTAVKLMWEYYNSGYEPGWIKGGEREEGTLVRRKLEDIKTELKPRHIIYFEDPFGKTEYKRREGLERGIGTTIDAVRQVEDVYVIITSREEVFKEFEREKISAKELEEFEEKLNIKKASYDYERRKQILLNWAEAESCKWLGNNELKELVLKAIEDEKALPTPLSIKDFASASFDIEEKSGLEEKIKEKSKETAKAFAKEIKNMTKDKILFLSFPFISEYFGVDLSRKTYWEMVRELKLEGAWQFDRVLNWFKDDKIDISGNRIGFSHPSYSEALPYLLAEDGYPTPINEKIFSKLLIKLAEKDGVALAVVWAVADNFDKLPEDMRNKLLFKLAEKDGAALAVVWAVADNFDKLPEDMRNKLLFKLAENDKAALSFAWEIAANFDKLPGDVRDKLLFKLAEKDGAARGVAGVVAANFDKLPEKVRKLLFKLAENDEAASDVARAVAANFDKLPMDVRNKLLIKLAEKGMAAGAVVRAVANNFDKLPDNVRDLLDKLQKPLQHVIEDLSNSHNHAKEEALELISNALPKLDPDFALKILNELSESEYEPVRTKAEKMLDRLKEP
ncbi:MAG: hypothetical protein AEth_00918 [Candidatus Argoarchaeum ethanivorans]|uniref:Novel STAND NTPase 3 domain-containing protein n=1 Tax=Candidatus Argoarchaeum ethanivorans TaxID=2608793 RepID=A0A8B3S2K8_9EURY|nr:MAG: hypothetical protein AEth_00918 [Candidatus Argoarchaeum ethanivorans]